MSIFDRINILAKEKGVSISCIEKTIGLSNGIIKKWDNQNPTCDKLKLVADYFDTTVDFLMTGKPIDDTPINLKNINNTVIGYNSSISGNQISIPDDDNEYIEIINYLNNLSVRNRRRAKLDIIELLEDNYPLEQPENEIL